MATPESITAGDFNGDGRTDLAVAVSDLGSDLVSILLGDGHGGFQVQPPIAPGNRRN